MLVGISIIKKEEGEEEKKANRGGWKRDFLWHALLFEYMNFFLAKVTPVVSKWVVFTVGKMVAKSWKWILDANKTIETKKFVKWIFDVQMRIPVNDNHTLVYILYMWTDGTLSTIMEGTPKRFYANLFC